MPCRLYTHVVDALPCVNHDVTQLLVLTASTSAAVRWLRVGKTGTPAQSSASGIQPEERIGINDGQV